MDLLKMLAEMHEERRRLDTIIAKLENLQSAKSRKPVAGQGRKGRDSEARKAASERMKRYWAARKEKGPDGPEPPKAETEPDSK